MAGRQVDWPLCGLPLLKLPLLKLPLLKLLLFLQDLGSTLYGSHFFNIKPCAANPADLNWLLDGYMHILVVEDEAMTVMLMKMLLKQLGYNEVSAVASGEKALALIDNIRPELIFMDILLAGKMDGIETTSRILEKISCPVVYTTGYDSKEIYERAMASGAVDYLLKPVIKDDIAAVMLKLFGVTAGA